MNSTRYIRSILMLIALALFSACSGGSGAGSSASQNSDGATTAVSGMVVAGPASGSSVVVKTATGTIVAGPFITAGDGSYSGIIPASALSADLVFEASGGTFPDEATYDDPNNRNVSFGMLSAFVPGGTLAAGSNITIDPSSSIIRQLVSGGKTRTAAESVFSAAFGYPADYSIKPAFANLSTPSSDAQRRAGLQAASFSQLTKELGLAPHKQFELIQALAEDLSDDVLDGKKSGIVVMTASGTPLGEDIGNRFASAMVAFQGSSLNKSKLTADKIGDLPFNKCSVTNSYKVEYIPGTMAASVGKSSFKIKLTNRSGGTPASGKTITLKPIMHMATMSHSTPVDAVVDNGDGTYSCTVYYLMASGAGMGFWDLKVIIGSGTTAETAVFYPPVAMAMGSSTVRGTLKGVADSISSMGKSEKRSYYLFRDGLTPSNNGYTFKLFIAAKESLMSYPAVSTGTVLTGLTVQTMLVEASTDGGVSWIPATAGSGAGHWTFSGLAGLTAGVNGTINVRLTINGEQKSTDGAAAAGTKGYVNFTVTP